MAGANLSDDVALNAAVSAGLTRVLVAHGLITAGDLVRVANSAGLSEAQAGQFGRGELTLPPHQTLTLMVAAFERLRVMQLSAAESRASTSAVARAANLSEETEEGALAELGRLGKLFPDWRARVDGLETIAAGKPKLVWAAKHKSPSTWPEVSAATAKELRGKLERVEASLEADRETRRRYNDGRGVPRR